tara:strand:- start:3262 stop:3522 length:261 start_codon:yes stop_codon:yes gene_type:complete
MNKNINDLWFRWFYKNWKEYKPGDLIDKGLKPSKIAENFINQKNEKLIELSKEYDDKNFEALQQFMELTESELHIIKYFLKLIKIN